MTNHRIAIIGAGPAGLTAGLYTSRADIDTTIYTGFTPGGQLTTTTEIENFPGAWNPENKEGLMGPDLMSNIQAQAEHFGAKVIYEAIETITWSDIMTGNKTKRIFSLQGDTTQEYDAVIIATGATSRYLGLDGEMKWVGKGYHTCATCDGSFYKDKILAVVGGGDSAMEEANFLTKFASKVYLIHRTDQYKASKIMLERAKNNPKIEFMPFYTVTEFVINDSNKFAGVKLQSQIDQSLSQLTVNGLFVAIGHIPNSQLVAGQLTTDEAGYLINRQNLLPGKLSLNPQLDIAWSKFNTMSDVEGLFLAGDIQDKTYRQAITAAGDGCRASIDAQNWLESL